jgi:hypothetical protein
MGRRRKSGKRTASGRLSRAHRDPDVTDRGTAEGIRNRHHLVNGAPVELAGSAIGVLLAGGHVDLEQVKAASRYAWLRSISFGVARPTVAYDLVEPRSPRLRSEKNLLELRQRFEDLVGKLGRDQKSALEAIVVDGRLPHWFRTLKLGRRLDAEDEAEREALLSGLTALAE